jgi:pimeloyl-ACP methyl ester carboxylesterase
MVEFHDKRRSRVGGMVLATAGLLGAAALTSAWRGRRAEREHPPSGRFLEIAGVRMHYLERGTGPPVVLLHGNGAMIQDFTISGVFDRLAQSYRVIALDRPGFGHTSRPRSQVWNAAAQAELVHEALLRLGVGPAILLAHSWGTLAALSLALNHPSDVRALVLLAGYYFPSLRAHALALSPAAAPLIGDILDWTLLPLLGRVARPLVFRRLFAPAAPSPRFSAEFPVALALRPSQIRASALDTSLMAASAAAIAERYPELRIPIVIMAGRGDRIVDFAGQSARLAAALPNATLIPFDDAGHMIHHAVPEEVVEAVELARRRSTDGVHRPAPNPESPRDAETTARAELAARHADLRRG